MKVSYVTVGSVGGYTYVFSETDAAAQGFDASVAGAGMPEYSPDFTAEVQEQSTAFALLGRFRSPMGNVKSTLNLTFLQGYATRQAALVGLRTWKTAFMNTLVHLRVEEGLTEVHYYPNALISRFHPSVQGASVVFQLTFETDDMTTVDPTT